MFLYACQLPQVFKILDSWYAKHGFGEDKKKRLRPIWLIFMFDGCIDPTKTNRNRIHAERAELLGKLARKIAGGLATSDDIKQFQKVRKRAVRFVGGYTWSNTQ